MNQRDCIVIEEVCGGYLYAYFEEFANVKNGFKFKKISIEEFFAMQKEEKPIAVYAPKQWQKERVADFYGIKPYTKYGQYPVFDYITYSERHSSLHSWKHSKYANEQDHKVLDFYEFCAKNNIPPEPLYVKDKSNGRIYEVKEWNVMLYEAPTVTIGEGHQSEICLENWEPATREEYEQQNKDPIPDLPSLEFINQNSAFASSNDLRKILKEEEIIKRKLDWVVKEINGDTIIDFTNPMQKKFKPIYWAQSDELTIKIIWYDWVLPFTIKDENLCEKFIEKHGESIKYYFKNLNP